MKYIIRNTDTGCYYEQDFAGWSWQADIKMAYKFNTEQVAMWHVKNVIENETCCVVEAV